VKKLLFVVSPVKTGVQEFLNDLKILDPASAGMTEKGCKSIFSHLLNGYESGVSLDRNGEIAY
jgi:hypothetical protein